MVHLYELRNAENQVEYVGVTNNIRVRFFQHTQCKPKVNADSSRGLFYGRTDLTIHQLETYTTRTLAMRAEALHKIELGFKPTERIASIKGSKVSANVLRKLNMQQSNEIKELYATGNYTQKAIAKHLNVAQCTINRIVNNKTYQEV